MFSKRWNPSAQARISYEAQFSTQNWRALSIEIKQEHSLSSCIACSRNHLDLQQMFPGKPVFEAPRIITLSLPSQVHTSNKQEKEEARAVLGELNAQWENRYDHTLTSALPRVAPQYNLTEKRKKVETKKRNRQEKRKISRHIAHQLGENATITHLAEAESLSSYRRKRLSMSFEQRPVKKGKSHSPSQENQTWNHEEALALLHAHPPHKKINWSETSRNLNIPNKNAGQVLKEFAMQQGFNTPAMECQNETPPSRHRKSKKKLPGGEISTPALPKPEAIAEEKRQLIASGQLSIGEPCSPYTLTKHVVSSDGDVLVKKIEIHGRKVPLLELRQKMLIKQQKYMRLMTDDDLHNLSREEIVAEMSRVQHTPDDNKSLQELQHDLAALQRTRTIAMWHDHSTVLQQGYILFAVWIVYDPAVFFSEQECKASLNITVKNLQEEIEQPTIYMIAPSTSSGEEQLALTGDRIECLNEMSVSLTATNGISITDKMRFFCGDKPAQQFERVTQIGGTYKCGACGCVDSMMQDLAHVFRCKPRSLQELQTLVLAGKYGNASGQLKPLDNLLVDHLRAELQARGCCTRGKLKPALQSELTTILKGVQRVPTLLTLNPTQTLQSLNLEHYEIMDCEPLHDFKGHAFNLLQEIPHLFSTPLKENIKDIIETTAPKQKVTGALLRVATIKLYLKLLKLSEVDNRVKQLIGTLVKISEILYAKNASRSPKAVLQLYNVTWMHHELCCDLIPNPKEQTRQKLYGVYLHDLVTHAPTQYQIICLRSTNAESTERLFSQVKHISLKATNRKPDNVLTTVLLSMQAKEMTSTSHTPQSQESMVSQVAKPVPSYEGTVVSKAFLEQRLPSWQAHLVRISQYLELGNMVERKSW